MKASYSTMEEAILSADDNRKERPFRCHVHDDHQASASVNVDKRVWVCYTCHAAGRIGGEVIETDFQRARNDIFDLLTEEDGTWLSESMLELYTAGDPDPYWRSRFSDDAIRHFQLGTDPVSKRPCYPMRDASGRLLGVVMRNLDRQPKYRYPSGVKANRLLWNYTPDARKQIILTEGAMDVISAWEVGVEAFGIYGSHLSDPQVELICRLSPRWVHLAFDNDAAGRKCAKDARVVLERQGIMVNQLDWRTHPFHKDLGELSMAARRTSLTNLLAL